MSQNNHHSDDNLNNNLNNNHHHKNNKRHHFNSTPSPSTFLGSEYFPKEKRPPYFFHQGIDSSGGVGFHYPYSLEERLFRNRNGGEGDSTGGSGEGGEGSRSVLHRVSSITSILGGSSSSTAAEVNKRLNAINSKHDANETASSSGPLSHDGAFNRSSNSNNINDKSILADGGTSNLDYNTSGQRRYHQQQYQYHQHQQLIDPNMNPNEENTVTPTWRLKERMKTVGVGLILALNIGTDPPDVNKPNPCAKLQCWIDPTSTSRAKARERIGERLESQYARWQQRAKLKYKRALDPTVEEVRNLCVSMRRNARNERLLLHYNGHGVPRPTKNGEIWVFDKNHTQYIPLGVGDLRRWIGKPSLVILDCSGAGVLLPFLTGSIDGNMNNANGTDGNDNSGNGEGYNASSPQVMNHNGIGVGGSETGMSGGGIPMTPAMATQSTNNINTHVNGASLPTPGAAEGESEASYAARSVRDTIVLCPTSPKDLLPLNPELPADLFTSCLTTPIPVALRWFVHQNPPSCSTLDAESVDLIPGKLNDRKTPLGELNWIFTAITDTIAWNILPSPLFQRLFRQDLLVASMFRNFLLADRILRDLNCTPMSYPALPSTCDHPLWQAWDLAVETCLSQLMRDGVLGAVSMSRPVSHHVAGEDKDDDDDDEDDSNDDQAAGGGDGTGGNAGHGGNVNGNTQHNPQRYHPQQQQQQQQQYHQSELGMRPKIFSHNNGGGTASNTNHNHTQRLQPTNPFASTATPQSSSSSSITAPFFAEQLTAFEIWLEFAATRIKEGGVILNPPRKQYGNNNGFIPHRSIEWFMYPGMSPDMESPEQLPVVLQVLLSQAHRVRALVLLRRFLDLGPSAVNLALSVGIFPYVLKLLQSPIDEYKHVLVGIWAKILEFDPSCQADLVKDGALPPFIQHLHWGLQKHNDLNGNRTALMVARRNADAAHQRTMAAVILSAICLGYPLGQTECIRKNLHRSCSSLLQSVEIGDRNKEDAVEFLQSVEEQVPAQFRLWLCICLGILVKDNPAAQIEAFNTEVHQRLFARLHDDSSDVRAGACFALGCLIRSPTNHGPSFDHKDDSTSGGGYGKASNGSVIPPILAGGNGTMPFNATGPSTPGVGMNPTLLAPQGAAAMGLQPSPMGNLPWQKQQEQKLLPMQSQFQPQTYGSTAVPSTLGPVGLMPGGGMYNQLTPQTLPPFQQQQHMQQKSQRTPSIYEDRYRLNHNLMIAKSLIEATSDASATVRYEAVLVLGVVVGKYLHAVAAVAEEMASASAAKVEDERALSPIKSELDRSSNSVSPNKSEMKANNSPNRDTSGDRTTENSKKKNIIPLPQGVDDETTDVLGHVWKRLRSLQHTDPHPAVSEACTAIVSVVHEHILILKTRYQQAQEQRRQIINYNSSEGGRALSGPKESGGQERTLSPRSHQRFMRANSSNILGNKSQSPPAEVGPNPPMHGSPKKERLPPPSNLNPKSMTNLRRNQSDLIMEGGWGARNGGDLEYEKPNNIWDHNNHGGKHPSSHREDQYKLDYFLPESRFFEWQKAVFEQQESKSYYDDRFTIPLDPLSPEGAVQSYREQRNIIVREESESFSKYFAALGPKSGQRRSLLGDTNPYDSSTDILGDFQDEVTADALAAHEADVAAKKRALHVSQSSLLMNNERKMTYMLRFHSYEPALIACDGSDGISIWDTNTSTKINRFKNGNPKESRMTSLSWINEMNSSLLLTGSDDGSIRIWDGIIEGDGAISPENPTLSAAFFAAPELVAGQRGSGLVTEWQQSHGRLLASGSTKVIRCWDLETEKCKHTLESNVDACLTTLTTTWDYISLLDAQDNQLSQGFSGIGPDIFVAGYGDGTLKVFDLRSHHRGAVGSTGSPSKTSRRVRRNRQMIYSEHSHWIVNTSFAHSGGRCEIISGCVAGDIKFWDLRMQTSLRTVNIQRSPMTALACHSRIPLLATGSHAQFIKLVTPDGDTLQLIRYHDKISGQRIGPVSCLTFHPNKPLLAAGATDEIISLYSPKDDYKMSTG